MFACNKHFSKNQNVSLSLPSFSHSISDSVCLSLPHKCVLFLKNIVIATLPNPFPPYSPTPLQTHTHTHTHTHARAHTHTRTHTHTHSVSVRGVRNSYITHPAHPQPFATLCVCVCVCVYLCVCECLCVCVCV